jgi:undecaprenyl-diphosphatase
VRWLYDFDMDAFKAIHIDMHREWLDPLFWVLSYSGLGQVQAIFIIALLYWKKTKFYVLPLLTTLIIAGLPVSQGVKLLIPRDRPSNLMLAVPQEEFLARSFPSGHSTTSFAIAFMLWLLTRKKEHAWIGKVAIGWAVLVGLSRVYRGVHWPTDVLAGACAGLFAASLVYLILGILGHLTHLDQPEASLSGQEAESLE